MKKLLLVLLALPFIGFGQKGNWSVSDLEKCKSDMKKGMYIEDTPENVDAIFNDLGKTTDEVVLCACELLEGKYSSFSEADNDPELEMMTEEQAAEFMMPCIFDAETGGWTSSIINEFMTNCAEDPALEAYCSCILEEIKEKYTVMEMEMLTEEDLTTNLYSYEYCITLIEN